MWASYAEVYNEKVYDLFDTSDKRKALSLKSDRQAGNKYIHGLKEVRIWSNDDAQSVYQKGQVNRQVFSTRLNGASSRSHSIFTIKVVRLSKGADPEDATALANVSRLSIVDLAGSERSKNTDTRGDRLKEAGNINKSLMVLGQCLEVLRKNREELAKGRKVSERLCTSCLRERRPLTCTRPLSRLPWFHSAIRSLQSCSRATLTATAVPS